jgi:hypothetical protein
LRKKKVRCAQKAVILRTKKAKPESFYAVARNPGFIKKAVQIAKLALNAMDLARVCISVCECIIAE